MKFAVNAVQAFRDLPVFHALRIHVGEAAAQVFVLLLERAHVFENGHALGKDRAARE